MIEAAIAAGADTAYLSGSGPTVAAITSGAAGDIFLQRTKERVDKQVRMYERMHVCMNVAGNAFKACERVPGVVVTKRKDSSLILIRRVLESSCFLSSCFLCAIFVIQMFEVAEVLECCSRRQNAGRCDLSVFERVNG